MNNLSNKKVIVAHSGMQHSLRLAEALKKEGSLYKYITTVYNKKGSLTKKITYMLKGDNKKRANSKLSDNLEENDIKQFCEWMGLINLILIRVDKSLRLYTFWNQYVNIRFGIKVAKYAIKNNVDAVIMYDTTSKKCFEILEKKAPHIKRIMDVSAVDRLYMKQIYKEDMQNCIKFADKLNNEIGFLFKERYINWIQLENKLTQHFIVPSQFVKKSLEFSGVKHDNIYICPYGVDLNKFDIKKYEKKTDKDKLKCIYIGNVTQMKGIYYLLESIKQFDKDKVDLKIVGAVNNRNGIFDEYKDRCDFIGQVTHDKVKEYLRDSDIMIFPSLGDSFGLVVLEAMSCGVPVICSFNAGASDIIVNYKNGFTVEDSSIEAIVEKIQWFMENRDNIELMGINANLTANDYTWNLYEKNISKIIKGILN